MNALNILELSEQEIIRRNNLQQLRDLGINPYPAAEYPTNAFSTEIKENFVVCQVFASLECNFCLVEHVVNFLHGVGSKLVCLSLFFLVGLFIQLVCYPSHIADGERAVEEFKKTS